MKKYIKSDLYRYYGRCDNITLIKALVFNKTYRFQFYIRLCQSKSIVISFLGRILYRFSKTKETISISYLTKIGYGLYIGHGGPIVVNPATVIGNNVNLSQFTTIGSNYEKAAIIGNECYIGPNVCIVEDVTIGSRSTIGAGSVVTKSIPENATAAGNYAKVLNYNNPGRFIKNKWLDCN